MDSNPYNGKLSIIKMKLSNWLGAYKLSILADIFSKVARIESSGPYTNWLFTEQAIIVDKQFATVFFTN